MPKQNCVAEMLWRLIPGTGFDPSKRRKGSEMTDQKRDIDIWIIMNRSGEFVVADDIEAAYEKSEEQFEEYEDIDKRQLQLTISMSPANGSQTPVQCSIEID
jgi:hypothetical protein